MASELEDLMRSQPAADYSWHHMFAAWCAAGLAIINTVAALVISPRMMAAAKRQQEFRSSVYKRLNRLESGDAADGKDIEHLTRELADVKQSVKVLPEMRTRIDVLWQAKHG